MSSETASGAAAIPSSAQAAAPAAVFDVGIHDKLPPAQALILGFQHIFGMIGMFVFPGVMGNVLHLSVDQTAHLYGMTFLVSGFVTACQALLILKLPIVHGPYVGSFTALLAHCPMPDWAWRSAPALSPASSGSCSRCRSAASALRDSSRAI